MTEPFLILHKVRGLPAFDIAERLDGSGTASDPGPWWVIPTSGHRAYPYWYVMLSLLREPTDPEMPSLILPFSVNPPADWPDHYFTRQIIIIRKPSVITLSELGL